MTQAHSDDGEADRAPEDARAGDRPAVPSRCTFLHHLQRAEDEATLALARTRWEARDTEPVEALATGRNA